MRIVVVARYFWPDLGGAQVQLRSLSRQWALDGHDVTVLTCRWSKPWKHDEVVDGYRVIRLPVMNVRFLGTIRFVLQVRRWLRANRGDFDVVMVSMLKHAAYAAAAVGRRDGFPVFLKSWGAGDSGDMAWQQSARMGRWIRRRTLDVAAVFAPSQAVAEEIRSAGYPNVVLIPNGVAVPSSPWNGAETRQWRRRLGIPDRTTLLTTGRLSPEKGLEDLLRAMPAILARRHDVQLVMVGDGPSRRQLEAQAKQLGVSERVLLVGAKPDVEPFLRAADLYLLPSRFEGLSVALLEALALGVPALASDTPANLGILPREFLPLFATADPVDLAAAALGRLEQLDTLGARLTEARTRVAKHFGIHAVAKMHLEQFARTTAHGGRQPAR